MTTFPKVSRRRASAAYATVGLLAGAAHVLASDGDSIRLWREVLPLAGIVGALLGAFMRPVGWLRGALVAMLAVPGFALLYAFAETAMMAGRGEVSTPADWVMGVAHWAGVVLAQAAAGGVVAALAGAAAGGWLGSKRPIA